VVCGDPPIRVEVELIVSRQEDDESRIPAVRVRVTVSAVDRANGDTNARYTLSVVRGALNERVSPIDRAELGCAAMAEFPPLDGSAPRKQQFSSPPDLGIDPNKRYTATLDTSLGEIVIALDALKAPQTVNNFVFLAAHHYYDGVIFHRIISGFMCQGGDPTGTGRGGPGYKFADELPKAGQYQIGSVAMANAGPNTNGSQFFLISGADGVRLPPQYSLFGQIVKGLDVLDQMQAVKTGGGDRPVEDVVINSVTITESD
jgi:peptidylprolyl isomerase